MDQLDCNPEGNRACIRNRPLRFLVITSTFPPRGGSSVQRVAKFCKYAKRLGAEPVVITARFERGLRDETLLDDLPSDLEVHRVAESVLGTSSAVSKLKRRFAGAFLADAHDAWRRAAYRKALDLALKRGFDAVFISYGAPSALRAGVAISKVLQIPVVIDIRDFKSKNILNQKAIQPHGRIRQYRINRLEKLLFPKISHFTAVSKTYISTLSSFYKIDPKSTTLIYNGYDSEDFACSAEFTEVDFENPVIRYVGFLTHLPSFENLIKALVKVNKSRAAQRQVPLQLEIIGQNNKAQLQEVLDKHFAWNWCKIIGYVPHHEAIKLMLSANILLLMQHGEAGVLTGKLFEYIGARRPILLLNNNNKELKELIEINAIGLVAQYDKVDDIQSAITHVLNKPSNLSSFDNPVFRRDFQAKQFLEVIGNAVANSQTQ